MTSHNFDPRNLKARKQTQRWNWERLFLVASLLVLVGMYFVGYSWLVLPYSLMFTAEVPQEPLELQESFTSARPTELASGESVNSRIVGSNLNSAPTAIFQADDTAARNPPDIEKGDFVHVVQSRFMQFQPNLLQLGAARLELFRIFCLPTMTRQTSHNFVWLIRTDPQLHASIRDRIIQLLQPYPHFFLVTSNIFHRAIRDDEAIADFHNNTSAVWSGSHAALMRVHELSKARITIETKLDADDGLHAQYIEHIQSDAQRLFEEEQAEPDSNSDPSPAHEASSNEKAARSPDWVSRFMVWCIEDHYEWHPTSPFLELPRKEAEDFPHGYLVNVPIDWCVTPGLSYAYGPDIHPLDLPALAHHKIHVVTPKCGSVYRKRIAPTDDDDDDDDTLAPRPVAETRAGEKKRDDDDDDDDDDNLDASNKARRRLRVRPARARSVRIRRNVNCLHTIDGIIPTAVRPRTATSAGMLRVIVSGPTNAADKSSDQTGKSEWPVIRSAQEQYDGQDDLWTQLWVTMGIRRPDAAEFSGFLRENLLGIARDSLEGDCNSGIGGTCRNRTQNGLKRVIELEEAKLKEQGSEPADATGGGSTATGEQL